MHRLDIAALSLVITPFLIAACGTAASPATGALATAPHGSGATPLSALAASCAAPAAVAASPSSPGPMPRSSGTLDDIENTMRIAGLVVNGRWIPGEERRRRLANLRTGGS